MFVWRADTVLALVDEHLPSLTATLRPAMERRGRGRGAALARAYRAITPASIDYAIMEKTARVIVVPGDFGWNDVGSWAAVADLGGTGQGGRAPVVAVDASGNVVFNPERLVALVGVDDVIVVDAPDAILICRKDRAQDVRRVVAELERRRLDAYL
jgi:mannose-1-phosphate guanylyltransferase